MPIATAPCSPPGSGAEHLLDALRRLALPVGSNDHVVARIVAGGAAADVTVIVGVAIFELHDVVAVLRHLRDRQDDRLGTQVQPGERIGRVAIRRDDRGVLVGVDARLILDLIEGRLELARTPVDSIFIHHRIVHHDRQAVDERFLGDRLGFADVGPYLRAGELPGRHEERYCQSEDCSFA